MNDLEQQIQALEVRADDYVKGLEKHYLESNRLRIKFDHYFFSDYDINPMWYDGEIRKNLFIARLEHIAWRMEYHHKNEQIKKEYRAPRKKVIRELDALDKALNNLSHSALRIITKSAIDLEEAEAFNDNDPIAMLKRILEIRNYSGEYPESSFCRGIWIKETRDVFDEFSVEPRGEVFEKTLALISDAAGIDYGEHGVKNAIKDILKEG